MKKIFIAALAGMLLLAGCQTAEKETTGEVSAEKSIEVTEEPTEEPTPEVTEEPTEEPTPEVTEEPTPEVTEEPTPEVTQEPTPEVTEEPTPEVTEEPTPEVTQEPTAEPTPEAVSTDPVTVAFDSNWEFAQFSVINSGSAVLYKASDNRKNIVIGVNAGHGTSGGESARTQCHPDGSAKVTGGTNAAGNTTAMAVSSGMTFSDGTAERDVTLREATLLKELLLQNGYDVLMIRESEDVQLDNVARTVMCNNMASCHIAIHWDGDGLGYDKGCFYMAVADGVKGMYPVSEIWQEDNRLGDCLIAGLSGQGCTIFEGGSMQMDLTQTSYSKVPSVDIELGNQSSAHGDDVLLNEAQGLLAGINAYFGF